MYVSTPICDNFVILLNGNDRVAIRVNDISVLRLLEGGVCSEICSNCRTKGCINCNNYLIMIVDGSNMSYEFETSKEMYAVYECILEHITSNIDANIIIEVSCPLTLDGVVNG